MKYLSMVTSMKTIFPKDVLDWFLWHKYLGFEHFYIIDDGCEPPVAEILEPYADEITYFDIENKNKLRSHREIVREMYNRFKHDSRWLAFMDEDEYLMPLGQKTIKEFLNTIEHKNGVYLQWRMFGPEGKKNALSEDEIQMDEYRTYSYRNQGKMILNCENVEDIKMPKGYDQHRLIREGIVDCYGDDINPEWLDRFYGQPEGVDGGVDIRPDMPFVINHYAYRSWQHMNYRMFKRGCIQRNDHHEFLMNRLLLDLVRFSNPKNQYLMNNHMRTFLFKDHVKLRRGYLNFYKKEMGK